MSGGRRPAGGPNRALVGVLVPIYLAWVSLKAALRQLARGLDTVGRAFVPAVRVFAVATRRLLAAAARALRPILRTVRRAFGRAVSRIVRALEPLLGAMRALGRHLGRGFRLLGSFVLRVARAIGRAVGRLFRLLGSMVEAIARSALMAAVTRVVRTAIRGIAGALRPVRRWLAAAARLILRVARTMVLPIVLAIRTALDAALAIGRRIRASIGAALAPVWRSLAAARAALAAMLLPVRKAFGDAARAIREVIREARRATRIRLGLPPEPTPRPAAASRSGRRATGGGTTRRPQPSAVAAVAVVSAVIVLLASAAGRLVGRGGLDDDLALFLGASLLAGLAAPRGDLRDGLVGFTIGMALVAVAGTIDPSAPSGIAELIEWWVNLTLFGGVAFLPARLLRRLPERGPGRRPTPASARGRQMAHRVSR